MKGSRLLQALLVMTMFSACVTTQQLRKEQVFFNEGVDTASINSYSILEPVIQRGDLLQISIVSRSSSTNQLFASNFSSGQVSMGGSTSAATGGGAAANSYLVDVTTGDIKLPLLGVIKADGLTKLQLEKEILSRASEYLKEDPIVNIRYLNYKVTVLGSVTQPGTKLFETERVTLLDALGQFGGIPAGGDIRKLLLIREQNGKRTMDVISLASADVFQPSKFYLRQNDVVIVNPTDRQLKVSDQSFMRTFQIVNIGVTVLNFIFIFITLFR